MQTSIQIIGPQNFNLKCITSALYDKLIEIIDDTYILYDKDDNTINLNHNIETIEIPIILYDIPDNNIIHSLESIVMNIIIDLNNKKILSGFGK